MKRTTLYVILGAVAVVAAAGAAVWRSRPAASSEEETRSAVAERGTLLVTVSASGSIEPQTRVSLAFEGAGRVAEVQVEVGDRVEASDVLAQLDTRQLALQVQQAQAAVDLAEAQLAQLQAGVRPDEVTAAEANVRAAEAQVSAAAANRDQLEAGPSAAQIAAAEAQVASVELQQLVTRYAHDKTVDETRDARKREQARYDLYAADKALAAAQAELDGLLAGADADAVRAARANVLAAAAQRDAAQAQFDLLLAGATGEQITDAQAQVSQARVALELAELSLRHATLRAPFDGVVAAVNVTAGEMAPAALPAITLLDTSRFRMSVSVDEMDVGQLVEGQSAQVTLDALPDVVVIVGTVERIAPAATFEGGVVTYDVVIELAPSDVPLRADMTANATIVVEELADVLKIPTWVVRVDRDTGQTYVHRQKGDEVERVDVDLGVRHEGVAQVLDGLAEGDELIFQEATSFGFEHP